MYGFELFTRHFEDKEKRKKYLIFVVTFVFEKA